MTGAEWETLNGQYITVKILLLETGIHFGSVQLDGVQVRCFSETGSGLVSLIQDEVNRLAKKITGVYNELPNV